MKGKDGKERQKDGTTGTRKDGQERDEKKRDGKEGEGKENDGEMKNNELVYGLWVPTYLKHDTHKVYTHKCTLP